jgi:hypothetical protein
MTLIKIADTLLKKAQDVLVQQKEQLDESLLKIAAVQQENTAYRDVLELVTAGVIDPADAFHKYEEFKQDPDLSRLMKKAHDMGFSEEHQKLGEATIQGGADFGSKESPEAAYITRLRHISEN